MAGYNNDIMKEIVDSYKTKRKKEKEKWRRRKEN
jgi:hypothetical protein